MDGIVDDIPNLQSILRESHSIAVVGLSTNWYRPSYFAAKYMQGHGYQIYPVNPRSEAILGEKCYAKLSDIPDSIEIVDCFRQAEHMPSIAEEAVAIGAKVLWLQLGIVSDAAARIALDGGLKVVMDRCMKIEHGRLFGGLNWVGVNTRVISAKRREKRKAPAQTV